MYGELHQNKSLTIFIYLFVTICWWNISPWGGIIYTEVSASALSWFIRYMYIYYWNLQFLNNIITPINKTKVRLLPGVIGDLRLCWLSCLGFLVYFYKDFHLDSNHLIMSIPNEGYFRNVSFTINLISTFLLKYILTS